MPFYDYQCQNCNEVTEVFQSMSEEPLTECNGCHQPALKRLISAGSGVIFKGSGFYVTDSRKSSPTENKAS